MRFLMIQVQMQYCRTRVAARIIAKAGGQAKKMYGKKTVYSVLVGNCTGLLIRMSRERIKSLCANAPRKADDQSPSV